MFEWNHNTHYHKLLLRELPNQSCSALDIGSGSGLFSFKLSSAFKEVFSLEPDEASCEYSQTRYESQSNMSFINNSFMEYDFKNQRFDYISAIASIHHMEFETSLEKMKMLLKPGGKIAVLGLYKESSLSDLLISLVAILPNLIMNTLSRQKKERDCEMITSLPEMTIREIKQVSHGVLENCHFRRHLFWRYSLVYKKPE